MKKAKIASQSNLLTTRAGSYSVFATLLVLGIVTVANMIVAVLPQSYLKLDATASKLYALSDQTKQVAESLRAEVVLYWVATKGGEDLSVKTLLSRYEDLSPHIVVKRIDPTERPNFVKNYTASKLSENSVIVEMGRRYKVVDYATIYAYDVSKFYETNEYQPYFDGEAVLTGAIGYVSDENIPKLYFLGGHGEPAATSYIAEKLQKDNLEVVFYNLVGGAAVPDDADVLFIYNPSSDYAKPEVEMLVSFVDKGGKLVLVTDFVNHRLPNLQYLAEYYALQTTPGLVIEGNSENYAWGKPYALFPKMNAHAVTNALKNRGYRILMPGASGFKQDQNARDSLSVTPLLVTSEDAFAKAEGYNLTTLEKTEGDAAGPFMVGALVKERVGTVQGEVIWYTSGDMLLRETDEMIAGANLDLFCNSAAFLAGSETTISIRSKGYMPELLQITGAAGNRIAVCLVGVVPLAYILPGLIIAVRRRRMK